jgi:hypothetical protein
MIGLTFPVGRSPTIVFMESFAAKKKRKRIGKVFQMRKEENKRNSESASQVLTQETKIRLEDCKTEAGLNCEAERKI